MQEKEIKNITIPLNFMDGMDVSYALGNTFTWVNPDNANQRGWELNQKIRTKLADGIIDCFVLALDDTKVKTLGGLGGIEIILNSQNNGFCLDYKSFPWYWDSKTQMGGYTSYSDLLSKRFTVLKSGIIYLKYDITSHPEYIGFIKDMISGMWGMFSIQYVLGIKDLPLVNAYLTDGEFFSNNLMKNKQTAIQKIKKYSPIPADNSFGKSLFRADKYRNVI